jgi:hypothetical protein
MTPDALAATMWARSSGCLVRPAIGPGARHNQEIHQIQLDATSRPGAVARRGDAGPLVASTSRFGEEKEIFFISAKILQ